MILQSILNQSCNLVLVPDQFMELFQFLLVIVVTLVVIGYIFMLIKFIKIHIKIIIFTGLLWYSNRRLLITYSLLLLEFCQ